MICRAHTTGLFVQITNKENEIQYYSCEENSVVQVEEVISDVHLEEVFSVPSISQQVLKDKQNIQHGSIGSRLNPALEPVCTQHKTDRQESVVLTSIEPEIIFEIVESQDDTVTEVNSHFAFQEPTVSCRLLNVETVCQIAKRVKTCGDPQVEQFHYSQNVFEHIGTTAIRCGMIYFLVGLLFTLVNNVAESFKRMCWSIFKFFHAFIVQMTKVCSLSTDFPAKSHSQNVDSETNATGKTKLVETTQETTIAESLSDCPDANDDFLSVEPDACSFDSCEINEQFIALLTPDPMPLSQNTTNVSVVGDIYGNKFSFLVDTGANVTAIKADVWRQLPALSKHPPIKTTIRSIKSVTGETIPVLGRVEVPFHINLRSYPFNALIIDAMAYDAILGRDFLEFYKAKIDLEHHTLALETEPSFFENFVTDKPVEGSTPFSCAVHAESSFIIPPQSEILVPGTLGSTRPVDSTGFIDTRAELAERYHILGAAQLVKVSNSQTVPIQLLNPTNQPVRIYRRTRLAQFSAADPEIATFDLAQADLEAEAGREVPTPLDTEPRVPLDVNDTNLSPEEQARVHQLLEKYADAFAYTPDQLGRCTVVKHTIDTGQHPPIRLRSYRTSPAKREEIEKQVHEMLENDIISPSVSPWSSPVVLVKKSDGTMRFCVDYRKLNQITRKDCHPLPRITEALDSMGGARFFSTLDLRSGYWQLEMEDNSNEKTAFITHNGLYEFNVLPLDFWTNKRFWS